MAENEQIGSIDRLDNCRKELDSKIEAKAKELGDKIENKISYPIFFGMLTIMVTLIGVVLAVFSSRMVDPTSKLDDLSKRVTVLETKLEERKK